MTAISRIASQLVLQKSKTQKAGTPDKKKDSGSEAQKAYELVGKISTLVMTATLMPFKLFATAEKLLNTKLEAEIRSGKEINVRRLARAAMRHPDFEVRDMAISRLGALKTREAVAELENIAVLGGENDTYGTNSDLALEMIKKTSHKDFINALARTITENKNPDTRLHAFDFLMKEKTANIAYSQKIRDALLKAFFIRDPSSFYDKLTHFAAAAAMVKFGMEPTHDGLFSGIINPKEVVLDALKGITCRATLDDYEITSYALRLLGFVDVKWVNRIRGAVSFFREIDTDMACVEPDYYDEEEHDRCS